MGQCCFHCCNEFQLKNFGFGNIHPARFSVFQWRLPPILYLLYRIALAAYTNTWLIYEAVQFQPNTTYNWTKINKEIENGTDEFVMYPFPAYLTNWTYVALTLYLTFHAAISLYYLCCKPVRLFRRVSAARHRTLFKELEIYPSLWGDNSYEVLDGNDHPDEEVSFRSQEKPDYLPWYGKVTWVLFNIASGAAVMVTIMFFLFLWPQMHKSGTGIDMGNLQLHGLTSVIIFIEHLMTAVPVRLLHFIYPFIYGLCYIIFSAIFFSAGNTAPIYPNVLDWNKAHVGESLLVVLLVGFVVFPILQVFFFLIYKAKICIFDKCAYEDD